MKREPSHKLRFSCTVIIGLCSPPTPFHQKYDFAKLIYHLMGEGLSVPDTLFIHTVSLYTKGFFRALFSSFHTFHGFYFLRGLNFPFSLFRGPFLTCITAKFTLCCYGLR